MDTNWEEKIIKEFGRNLEKLRTDRKITLRELAHRADVDHSTIHRIEKGDINTSLTMIVALAKALQLDVSDLFKSLKW